MSWSRLTATGSSAGEPDGVRLAINRAAQKTGVDFDYLFKQAKSESGLNPNARAGNSSAGGLFQFIDQSWLGAVKLYGAKHGLGWAADAIERKSDGSWKVDSSMRQAVFALREHPEASALMAGEFASDNADGLAQSLGRAPNGTDLYFAHFLGLEKATRFLKAEANRPDASAAAMFPREAQANRAIFYDKSGDARSLSQVYALMGRKIDDNGSAITGNGLNGLTDTLPVAKPGDPYRLAYAREIFETGDKTTPDTNDMLAMIGNPRANLLRPSPQTAMLAYMLLSDPGDSEAI